MVIKAPTDIDYIYKAKFDYDEGPIKNELSFEKSTEARTIQEKLEANIMGFGKPELWNLRKLCKNKNIKLPIEIESLLKRYDFWLIQSKVSFMPAPNSYLLWLRIASKIESLSQDIENPIFYDAYPKEIYKEGQEKRKKVLGLDLKFSELLDVSGEYVDEIESSRLEPVISIAGLGESEVFWDFREGASTNFRGLHALYSIVKLPPKSEGMKISYFARAQVKTKLGIFPVSLKQKLDGDKTYKIIFG
jgi:hypothetical protein